jgi:hypothetical protein
MPKSYCYITKKRGPHGGMGIYIDCSYDPDFLEVLKSHVPSNYREYDPINKQWWIDVRYAKQAVRDAKTFFENVMEV